MRAAMGRIKIYVTYDDRFLASGGGGGAADAPQFNVNTSIDRAKARNTWMFKK